MRSKREAPSVTANELVTNLMKGNPFIVRPCPGRQGKSQCLVTSHVVIGRQFFPQEEHRIDQPYEDLVQRLQDFASTRIPNALIIDVDVTYVYEQPHKTSNTATA